MLQICYTVSRAIRLDHKSRSRLPPTASATLVVVAAGQQVPGIVGSQVLAGGLHETQKNTALGICVMLSTITIIQINHFIQPSVNLSSVIANDVLLKATPKTDMQPETLLTMPRVTRFCNGTSMKCIPKPRLTLTVVAMQLVRSATCAS